MASPTQLSHLRRLLRTIAAGNRFYAPRLIAAGIDPDSAEFADFQRLPLTTKADLMADQAANPPWGTNLSYPLSEYCRFHQTSGSTGEPLRWLDDAASWQSLLSSWQQVFVAADVGKGDRVFFAFSFGPFLGFWTAFEAAAQLGCTVMPGGGMSTLARLRLLVDIGAKAICCTPTYAVRMGETAAANGIDLAKSGVKRVIVAGEPGGSIPAVRARIAELWPGAQAFDHHGMTEVGPVTYEDPTTPGTLIVVGDAYLVELVDPETGAPLPLGSRGELVLTTLQRLGSPLLRYRTGDLVEAVAAPDGSGDVRLRGGILTRCDDMVVVRGVNLYPAAVDVVVRRVPDVAEYRVLIEKRRGMDEVRIEVEAAAGADDPATALAAELRASFNLRIAVKTVPAGTLPRFEMKAKRWIRQ